MAGLVPYDGSIALDGAEVCRLPRREIAQRLAFVPQAPLLPPEMRVDEYVLLGRTPYIGSFSYESRRDLERFSAGTGAPRSRALRRPAAADPFRRRGQRTVLARALAQEAPFLLLDEPTTSLDLGRQQQVLELVAELREHGELTVLCAMHDLTLAGQYADRLLLLSQGRLDRRRPAGGDRDRGADLGPLWCRGAGDRAGRRDRGRSRYGAR